MNKILFSIITSHLNDYNNLLKTGKSLCNQTFNNFEWIVINGSDSDDAIKNLYDIKSEINLIIINEKDNGIYDAWNKGITLVRGEWISFVGAGDTYHADALEHYYRYINEHSEINYVSSKANVMNELEKVLRIQGESYNKNKIKRYMHGVHSGSFHKKDLLLKHYPFKQLKSAGDYDFFLRSNDSIIPGFIDIITINIESTGSSKTFHALLERFSLHNRYFGLFHSIYQLIISVIKFYIRKLIYKY